MDRSKSIMSILVGLAAIFIVYWVGIRPEPPEPVGTPKVAKATADPNKPADVKKPEDPNRPGTPVVAKEPEKPKDPNAPDKEVAKADEKKPVDPNDPMESLNLNNVQMKDIVKKLADWTGKAIIPSEESEKIKVTVYAPKQVPRSEALSLIYASLRMKGFTAKFTDKIIYIEPIGEAKLGEVPTIAADYPLELIENKDQIVQKFFRLQNYSPSQMGQILTPLMGEYGHVGADESTGSLMVIDTVRNLMRVDMIIKQYDVVGAEEVETQIFDIHNANPEDIVALLEKLLSGDSSGGSSSRFRPPFGRPPSRGSSSRSSSGAATTVTVGTSRTPAVLIPESTYSWVIAKATPEDLKQIGDWISKLDKAVQTVPDDQPLSAMANKNQVVQRFYRLQNYSSAQMAEVVGQLLTEEGHLSADESTRTLMVMDTVKNLMRIEEVIDEFDVPEAEQAVTDTFQIYYGDPGEIVQLLRTLLSFDGSGGSSSRSSRYGSSSYSRYGSSYGSSSRYGSSRYGGYSSYRPSSSRSSSGSQAVIGTSQVPIVLVPEPTRKWIIARSSAEDMKKIAEWIEKLDKEEKIEREYETVQLGYADVSEVAMRLNEAIQDMPGSELQQSVLIQPLTQARQIMVFGRKDLRELVKKLIKEIDIPSGLFETRVFKLKYADADKIKENLEALYEQEAGYQYGSSYSNRGYRGTSRQVETSETVRVIAYATMHQVTVIAAPENMLKIADQIAEWDVALDLDQIKPRILTLNNSDPVQMTDLLKTLFSEESSGGGNSFMRYFFGDDMEEKEKIVGPLYGQLTFEEVPGTKKIIVISNVAGAYEVIEDLVNELDSKDMAEVPEVIQLKYADPEDLSERLNALFVEAGQQAPIRRTEEGLTIESEMGDESDTNTNTNNNNNQAQQATYTPPWSGGGARSQLDTEMPISNVIGRVRFVPEPHTKSILTLSPPEFMSDIRTMISNLDVPGKQVIIEAIIVEIEHTKVTSLGVELATNPAAFSTLSENSLTALSNLTHIGSHGSASGLISPGASNPLAATGSGTILGVGTDIYALIDFLIKTTDARILNQQTIWTKDNEEASFFKGQEVAFLGGTTLIGGQGGSQQDVEFKKVGMELMVRPSITPEDKVDMLVNVHISQLLADIVNSQPVRDRMNTTTNMIVEDNQTLLLGGILFQQETKVETKLPLFGDLPLVGGLFRHNDATRSNNEMLVFLTPRVIDEERGEDAEQIPAVTEPPKKLKRFREQLDAVVPSPMADPNTTDQE